MNNNFLEFFSDSINKENKEIDLNIFKKIVYFGIPTENRKIAYKILLEVYSNKISEFEEIDQIKHKKYLEFLEEDSLSIEISMNSKMSIDLNVNENMKSNVNANMKSNVNSKKEISKITENIISDNNALTNTNNNTLTNNTLTNNTLKFFKSRYQITNKLIHQIHIDVLRIDPKYKTVGIFDISHIYENILRITAYRRPYFGYIQGMADLIVPFVEIFILNKDWKNNVNHINSNVNHINSNVNTHTHTHTHNTNHILNYQTLLFAESQIFFCFEGLINRIELFLHDMQESLIRNLEHVLSVLDQELYKYFHLIELDLHMIVFRWFNCLFIREFPLSEWFLVFDSMLSSDIGTFLVFFSAAILIDFREEILNKEFSEICMFFQKMKDLDSFVLKGKAVFLIGEYEELIKR